MESVQGHARSVITRLCVVAITLSVLLSCAPSYRVYRQNLLEGKHLMRRGEFQQAQTYLAKASEAESLPEALALAATAAYKANDLQAAQRYITEGEQKGGTSFFNLRIAGYKALVLLKEGDREGIKALQEYTTLYSHLYPLATIGEVEAMTETGKVDLGRLEVLLDEQITWYEDEVEQFRSTRTGYYGGWE